MELDSNVLDNFYKYETIGSKEPLMEVTGTITGLLMFILGFTNFAIVAQTEGAAFMNWLGGIVSVVAGAVCLMMVKHMLNEDRHVPRLLDPKKLVNIDLDRLVTRTDCKIKNDAVIEKIEQTRKEYLREIRHTKQLIRILLKQNGIEDVQELRGMNEDDE